MWHLKPSKENPDKPHVVYEGRIKEMANFGRSSWNVEVYYKHHRFCVVKLWSLGSCALSEFRNLRPDLMPNDNSFMDWLKTQPFEAIDSWAHEIFIFLPFRESVLDRYTGFKNFAEKHCSVISSFPNHAHGGHTLNLYQLDLTKYVPDPNIAVS